jgi:hypothetical protein
MFVILYLYFILNFNFCGIAHAQMDSETFSHNKKNTHMYINYRVIIWFRCNARALT